MYVCMYVWMDGWMDGWMYVCTFSKEVKPVLVYVWFQYDPFGRNHWFAFNCILRPNTSAGITYGWFQDFLGEVIGLVCLQLHCSTKYLSRGTELFDATLSYEAMHQRGKGGLINRLYLQILIGFETVG